MKIQDYYANPEFLSAPNTALQRSPRDRYLVPKSALDALPDELDNLGEDTSRFFKHILISGAFRPEDRRWVHVPVQSRRREFPEARLYGKPRLWTSHAGIRWRVRSRIYSDFVEALRTSDGDRQYDLFTGRKSDRIYRSRKYDANRNSRPSLVQEAMRSLSRGYFDRVGLFEHLSSSASSGRALVRKRKQAESTEESEALWERIERHHDRWARDHLCYSTLKHQASERHQDAVRSYELGYKMEPCGRLRQIGGGLQQCSTAMRHSAYAAVDESYEYRIKASIPTMLRDFMADTGWHSPLLERYLTGQNPASRYANIVGITAKEWRSLFKLLCYGAVNKVPLQFSSSSPTEGPLCPRFRRILKSRHGDLPDTSCLPGYYPYDEFVKFHDLVAEFKKRLEYWRMHLTREWLPKNRYVGRGGYWLENDVGCSLNVSDQQENTPLAPWILAFLLRGREAHFTHTLTIEADNAGVEVISNEQDGIVTIGEIPDSVLQTAKEKSPLDHVEVTEKPIL